MFFVVFRVCKATKFAFFDRERRAKTLNLNEWMRDEGSFREGMQSPGCCIITKEANNDYNRFQGGILKERTERRAGAQFSVFFFSFASSPHHRILLALHLPLRAKTSERWTVTSAENFKLL
jgi:hypothetical protein